MTSKSIDDIKKIIEELKELENKPPSDDAGIDAGFTRNCPNNNIYELYF